MTIIDIVANIACLGREKSQSPHWSYWGGKFVGISKTTCLKRFHMVEAVLDEDNPNVKALTLLGEGPLPQNLEERCT